MRKFIGLAAVIAFLWVSAAPAEAVTLPAAQVKAKYEDYSSFYRPAGVAGVAQPLGAPLLGDELRAMFRVTSIITDDASATIVFSAGPSEELTGLFYDLVVGGILVAPGDPVPPGGIAVPGVPSGTVVVDLLPGGRITVPAAPAPGGGGRMDIYDDFSPNFSVLGPGNWTAVPGPGPGGDIFPGVTDGNLWLAGTFVPLATVPFAGIPGVSAPFTAGAVSRVGFTLASGTGDGVGYLSAVINNTGTPLLPNRWGPFADIEIVWRLDFPPKQTVPAGWAVHSEDPVRFTVLPEPATMSLLLVGLVGGAGAYLKRRRVA